MLIEVDCRRIEANARAVSELCALRGVQVAGVTKAIRGEPAVARAMLAGGVTMLADSRLDNVRTLRDGGINAPVLLIRQPTRIEVDETIALCDLSLVSEVTTARALSASAERQGRNHGVIVMLETGDRREGVMPDGIGALCMQILELPGLELAGIGTVLGCLSGVIPTAGNRQSFVDVVERIEEEIGFRFEIVSAGNTDHLDLVQSGQLPSRINHLRVGEGIISGTIDFEVSADLPMPHRDAFTVRAEVIEVQVKPSAPDGEISVDAFMTAHTWLDRGVRRRALLSLGEIDMRTAGLRPLRDGVIMVGASSDLLAIDVTDAMPAVEVGDVLEFEATYVSVSTAWASRCPVSVLSIRE